MCLRVINYHSLAPNTTYFLTIAFQTMRSNLAWNNPKTLSLQDILRLHRGYNNVRENRMAKISAAKSIWVVNHPLSPPPKLAFIS